jgi:tetratricopeptide (TPR) repeat protein
MRAAPAPPPAAGEAPATLAERHRAALTRGDLTEAASLLFDRPRAETRGALEARDKLALGEALATSGYPRAALAAFQRVLADHPRGAERAAAHLAAARLLLATSGHATAAYQHLYEALEEEGPPEVRAEARRLLDELARVARHVPRSRA